MKNINKILMLFVFILVLSFVAIWEGLQSEWFANKVSVYATKYAKEIFKTDIEFRAIDFKIFPPGAELTQVAVKGNDQGVEFFTELSKLGFYFNPFDVFNTKFKIETIVLEDGQLDLESIASKKKNKKTEKKAKFSLNDVFTRISHLPLTQIEMKNFTLNYKEAELTVHNLKLKNKRGKVLVDGRFENISFFPLIKIKKTFDEFYIKAEVDARKVQIDESYVKKDFAMIKLFGRVDNYISENIKYRFKFDGGAPIVMAEEYINLSKVGKLDKGDSTFRGNLSGQGKEFRGSIDIAVQDFKTDFIYGDNFQGQFSFNNNRIRVRHGTLKAGEQLLRIEKPFELFNLKTKKWIEEPVEATASKLKTDNFLRILRNKLDFIQGTISGGVKFILEESFYTFEFDKKTFLHKLALVPGGKQVMLLRDFNFPKGFFRIDKKGFSADALLTKGESILPLKGFFSGDTSNLSLSNGRLELKEVDPFIDFKMGGLATLDFEMYKKGDLFIDVDLQADQFIFSEYYFDKFRTDLKVNLDRSTVRFNDLRGDIGITEVYSQGIINYKESKILADYQFKNLTLENMKTCLLEQWQKIKFDHKDINGVWSGGGSVSQGTTLDTMKLRGFLNGTNNYVYDENIEDLRLNYSLENNIFRVDKFSASKASGKINGSLIYDLARDKTDIKTKVTGLPLSEIFLYNQVPLDLQANLYGEIEGTLFQDKWDLKGLGRLTQTSVLSEEYADSSLTFEYIKEQLKFDISGFGDEIKLKSKLYLNNSKKISNLDVKLNIAELRKFFGIFTGVDVLDNSIQGSLVFDGKMDFDLNELHVINLDTNLKKMNLKKGLVDLAYANPKSEIEVKNGIIRKWKTNLRGRNFYIISDGQGDLNAKHKILTNLKIDASIMEIFSSVIPKANGNLRGKFLYANEKGTRDYEAVITSNNLSLSSQFLPTSITKTNMQISFSNNNLNIDRFKAELISGFLELKGGVNFNNVFPNINIQYEFKDAGITILKKSNLVFSGKGSFLGQKTPYSFSGDFFIQRFVLVNELADFTGGDDAFLNEDIKYLPGARQVTQDHLIDLSLNVATREPMYVKNSLADMGFVGGVQVVGSERDPRLVGSFALAPRENFVTFKNNKFLFSKGSVFYDRDDDLKNPSLNFLATTSINEYKIYTKLLGPVKKFDFSFSSEPALAQSDILSLVAFGYTDDVSGNLSDAEKESLTRASVGSLLFDSFKINETLKSEFGLQVNLGTEISRNEGSLLSQRNAESNVDSTGVTSATTFEIKKQLSEAMNLSVSSTVGDSRTERQGVNLNYIVNKKVSFEGVYETNNINENQTINNTNSFGADVKVRWSFK